MTNTQAITPQLPGRSADFRSSAPRGTRARRGHRFAAALRRLLDSRDFRQAQACRAIGAGGVAGGVYLLCLWSGSPYGASPVIVVPLVAVLLAVPVLFAFTSPKAPYGPARRARRGLHAAPRRLSVRHPEVAELRPAGRARTAALVAERDEAA